MQPVLTLFTKLLSDMPEGDHSHNRNGEKTAEYKKKKQSLSNFTAEKLFFQTSWS